MQVINRKITEVVTIIEVSIEVDYIALDKFWFDVLGNRLDGESHTYRTYMQHLHVTFQDEPQETQKSFHDNVNSAECTCNFGKLY